MLRLECQKIKGRPYTTAYSNCVKLMGTLSYRKSPEMLLQPILNTHTHTSKVAPFFALQTRLIGEIS